MTEADKKDFSFKKYAWEQFKKNKPAYISFKILVFFAIMALLAPIIANDQPLYVNYKGTVLFPAFSFANKVEIKDEATGKTEELQLDITDWKKLEAESILWALIPYSPNKADLINADYIGPNDEQQFVGADGQAVEMPTRFRHWLGTNKRGEDVLAGLIHGTRISLTIGILSMGIASIIGLVLGAMAGYFGDKSVSTTRGSFIVFVIGIILAFYYAFMMRSYSLSDGLASSGTSILLQLFISLALFIAILYIFYYLGKIIGKAPVPFINTKVFIPVDSIISRTIEIMISLPLLILIISIAAIAKPSIVNLMVIIGLTSWTGIARFTRAEFLRIRNLEYIQAARSLGFEQKRIIFKHALPNGIAPALVSIAFGIASAILVESSLSFLGIGVPADTVTWGSLLSAGRENYNAWWLVIFPGFAIFTTVTIYNLIGEGLRDALDPRLKK